MNKLYESRVEYVTGAAALYVLGLQMGKGNLNNYVAQQQ